MHVTYADVARHPIWLRGRTFTNGNASGMCLAPDRNLQLSLACIKVNDVNADNECVVS